MILDRIKAYLAELSALPLNKWYSSEYFQLVKVLVKKYGL